MEMKQPHYSLGVDLGGTKLRVGLIDTKGRVIDSKSQPTDVQGGPSAIGLQITQAVKELITNHNIAPKACGIGLAGQIDSKTGVVHFAPNLAWKNVPIKQYLEKDLHIPVHVINDVRAATWGESKHGAAVGYDDVVCIFVGTGIGGGIVANRKVLEGANNCAGEIGHMVIQMNGNDCTCGQKGCWEAYASGWAITKAAKQAVIKDPKHGKTLLQLSGGALDAITAKIVTQAFKQNDPLALTIIQEAQHALHIGTANILNILNPKALLFGGGIIQNNDSLFSSIKSNYSKYALKSASKNIEVLQAALGSDAGIIGAAVFAYAQLSHKQIE